MSLQHYIIKEKLKNIASVQMGFSFRSRLSPDPKGNVAIIQMKDLNECNRLDTNKLVIIDMDDLKSKHRTQPLDIAFRSRGLTNKAALIDADIENSVIAAPLIRIRVTQKSKIDPAYLCWYINQRLSQTSLIRHATGSTMRMIGIPALENLEVAIPPIDVQIKISALERFALTEQKLMKELAGKKAQLREETLIQLASNSQLSTLS